MQLECPLCSKSGHMQCSNSRSIGASIDVIFVSLAEHYARIIADEGIARKVHQPEWQAAIEALDGAYARRSDAAGFIARRACEPRAARRLVQRAARPALCNAAPKVGTKQDLEPFSNRFR
jgi:hypothetical protein